MKLWGRQVVGFVALSAAVACDRGTEPSPRADAAASASAPRAVTARPGLPAIAPADRLAFALECSSEASIGKQPLTQFDLRATLLLTAVDVSDGGVLFLAELRQPQVTSRQVELAKGFEEASRQLAMSFFFELAPGGTVRATYFSEGTSSLAQGIARSIAAAMQSPLEPPASKLVRRELDGTGSYEAEYSPTSDPRRALRKKLRYFEADGAANGPLGATKPRALIDESRGEVVIGPLGLLERSVVDEKLRLEAGMSEPIAVSTKLTLSQLRVERASNVEVKQAQELRKQFKPFEAADAFEAVKESPALDSARIAGRTVPQVLSALRAHEALERPKDKDAQAAHDRVGRDSYSALEALIRVRPQTITELAALILAKDKLSVLFIDALGSAGSPQGHEALHGLLREGELDATHAKVAAISLSRTSRPSEQSIAALRTLLADPKLGTQAVLGLGTTVRRLAETGEATRAEQLLTVILERLDAARDDIERVATLRAIANSGHARAFDKVVPLLSNEEAALRVAALEALRLMKHPGVDERFAAAIRGDERAKVRIEAVNSARLRPPSDTLRVAVVAAGEQDVDPHVRLAAVRTLREWLRVRPELREPLARIAAAEKVEHIKQQASKALETKSP